MQEATRLGTNALKNPVSRSLEQSSAPAALKEKRRPVVLLLRGGGALGAYQVGFRHAVPEAEIDPDWRQGA
jgi:predicted acylesterase/phospholipase RssA